MANCSSCGKKIDGRVYPDEQCQGCCLYFHRGGLVNEIPPVGEVKYDHRGYVICHICGRAYTRLGSHIRESHGMVIDEYKEKFELCGGAKTTEEKYSAKMSALAYRNKMVERLLVVGVETRIKKGETKLRKGKKTRLQETKMKRDRKRIVA